MSDPFGYGGGYTPNYAMQDPQTAGTPNSVRPYDPMGGMEAAAGAGRIGGPTPSTDMFGNSMLPSFDPISGGPDYMGGMVSSKGFRSKRPAAPPQYGLAQADTGFSADQLTFKNQPAPFSFDVKGVAADPNNLQYAPSGRWKLRPANPLEKLGQLGANIDLSAGADKSGYAFRTGGAEDLLQSMKDLGAGGLREMGRFRDAENRPITLGGIQDLYSQAASGMKAAYDNPATRTHVGKFEGGMDTQMNYLQAAYNQLMRNMSQLGYL